MCRHQFLKTKNSGDAPPASRAVAALFALCLLAFTLFGPGRAVATGAPPRRFIAIVYDDSGSMRYDERNRDVYKNYVYANYSLQNLAALLEPRDSAKVYLISRRGKDPIAIPKRQKDLYEAMKGIGAQPSRDTHAETLLAAMKDGAAFLRDDPGAEFLMVLITDGASMYVKGKEIKGPLDGVFTGYLKASGLDAYKSRARALLLSIVTSKPLSPVTDLREALKAAGIPAEVFLADVTDGGKAGDQIMEEMTDLAGAMASTDDMPVIPGKAFTIRYPLESLVVMEQFEQSSGSLIKSIKGANGTVLKRTTLFTTKAIGKIRLASTFSSVRAETGSILPGEYTLEASGNAKVLAFAKIGFSARILLADKSGNAVAAFRDGKWDTGGITLPGGGKLDAQVSFVALDGTSVPVDTNVKIGFGAPERFACKVTGPGAFSLEAGTPGLDYLSIGLEDPRFFRIAIPPLPVTVPEAAQESQAPTQSASAATAPEQTPFPTASPEPDAAFDGRDLAAISNQAIEVEYTSSDEPVQAAEYAFGATEGKELQASLAGIPDGIQIRINDAVFDAAHPSGAVRISERNTLSVWAGGRFSAEGRQAVSAVFSDGTVLQLTLLSKPRLLRVEVTPEALRFGVLDGAGAIPPSAFTVWIGQGGAWREAAPKEIPVLQALKPGGLSAVIDTQRRTVSVSPAWPAVLAPVGESAVVVRAATGKPGEVAEAVLAVTVADDWRKWLHAAALLLPAMLLAAYATALLLKKRIPMELYAYRATNPDLSGAEEFALPRNLPQRNWWPFGRETCMIGRLELFPHAKDPNLVVVSSIAVQYGLTLDGKAPQHHKRRDKAGDFIVGPDTVVGVRDSDGYRYYRFVYQGAKLRRTVFKARHAKK